MSVSDLTIVLGPPGPDELKKQIKQWADNAGKSEEDMYLEYGQSVLRELSERKPGEKSGLDELFSAFLEKDVEVWEPFVTFFFQAGHRYPAIMVYTNKITDATGAPAGVDLGNQATQNSIGAALGHLMKTEWVRSFTASFM